MSVRRILRVEYSNACPIPYSKFKLIANTSVKRLLKDSISQVDDERALATIKRLRAIAPTAAQYLRPKSKAVDNLQFRVLRTGDESVDLSSYITLSYRWQRWKSDLAKVDAVEGEEHVGLPVSATLLQASLDELRSEGEGLWFDQGCIRQEDALEVDYAIGAMDLIYRSARVVVVALDDVVMSMEQCRMLVRSLRNSKHRPSPLKDPRIRLMMRGIVAKVMSSEYFSRAWCRHEFLMGQKHIFLLRIRDSNAILDDRFLRLTDQNLHVMLDSIASPMIFGGRSSGQRHSELHAYYGTRNLATGNSESANSVASSAQHMLTVASISRLKAAGSPHVPEELRQHDGNADKMAIMLNSTNTGLVLDRSSFSKEDHILMTDDACVQRMTLLSLAQGSPLALCARGDPLQDATSELSWLRRMTRGDIEDIGNLRGELPSVAGRWPIRLDPSRACSYVDLDLVVLKQVRSASSATVESLVLAEKIIRMAKKLASDAQTGRGTREVLARLIDAGRDWIPGAREDYDTTPGDTGSDETRQTLRGAFERLLNPAWKGLRIDLDVADIADPFAQADADRIWNYVFAITKQNPIPFRPMRGSSDRFDMVWLQGGNGQLAVAFTPPDMQDVMFAVPAAITQAEYESLARCWVLERHEAKESQARGNGEEWTTRAKIKFGEHLAFDDLESGKWDIRALRVVSTRGEKLHEEMSYK